MREIWITELLVTLFLFLHISKPFIKALRSIEGVTWLPLLALILTVAIFPAYGFRPEVLPLLLFTVFYTGIGIFMHQRDTARFRRYETTRPVFYIPPLVLLAVTAGIAFYFTPAKDTAFISDGVYSFKLTAGRRDAQNNAGNIFGDAAADETEYFVRVYIDPNDLQPSGRPLLILMPAAFGSLTAVDLVSSELRDRGFTVLTYSRKGLDSPAFNVTGEGKTERYGISPAEWLRRFSAFSSGTVSVKTNNYGRSLEEEREKDIQFLLSWISGNPLLNGKIPLFSIASADAVFLAGYDASGSALILLQNTILQNTLSQYGKEENSLANIPDSPADPLSEQVQPQLPQSQPESKMENKKGINIRALIAIESRLWSLYSPEIPEIPPLSPEAGWFESVRYGINRWFMDIKPKKIAGVGQIPKISSPVLFLISDRERERQYSEGKFLALFKCFEAARSSAVMGSADGAGPLDYSDFPVRYPFITAFFRGRQKRVWNNTDAPAGTANIIANFAFSVLTADDGAASRIASRLKKTPLPEGVRLTYK